MSSSAALGLSRGLVRPATEEDLAAIVALHRRCFAPGGEVAEPRLRCHLRDLFFDHPWPDERLPSLAYEDEEGDLVGCLGVMPRPMLLEGRPVLAAVSHDFMVDPARRGGLVAVELLRSFLAGPQALSLAEGNDLSRRIWEAMGGVIAVPYSLRWTRTIRPASHAVSRLSGEGRGSLVRQVLRPVARLADRVATRPKRSPLRIPPSRHEEEALDLATLKGCIDSAADEKALRPVWTEETLGGALKILDGCPGREPLRRRLVLRDGVPRGWYLYHPRPGGVGAVVQAAVAPRGAGGVFDHLFGDAEAHETNALTGLLGPELVPHLSERACLFHRGKNASWLLVHGREERAVRALRQGDAWFTHLEGEFWV